MQEGMLNSIGPALLRLAWPDVAKGAGRRTVRWWAVVAGICLCLAVVSTIIENWTVESERGALHMPGMWLMILGMYLGCILAWRLACAELVAAWVAVAVVSPLLLSILFGVRATSFKVIVAGLFASTLPGAINVIRASRSARGAPVVAVEPSEATIATEARAPRLQTTVGTRAEDISGPMRDQMPLAIFYTLLGAMLASLFWPIWRELLHRPIATELELIAAYWSHPSEFAAGRAARLPLGLALEAAGSCLLVAGLSGVGCRLLELGIMYGGLSDRWKSRSVALNRPFEWVKSWVTPDRGQTPRARSDTELDQ